MWYSVLCVCGAVRRYTYGHGRRAAQSINQRSSQSHTRAEEKPHPSTITGGANPASRSDAGLGGYARVATALVCETRSFGARLINTVPPREGGGTRTHHKFHKTNKGRNSERSNFTDGPRPTGGSNSPLALGSRDTPRELITTKARIIVPCNVPAYSHSHGQSISSQSTTRHHMHSAASVCWHITGLTRRGVGMYTSSPRRLSRRISLCVRASCLVNVNMAKRNKLLQRALCYC